MQSLYSLRLFRKKVLNIKKISDEDSILKGVNELFEGIDTKKKKFGVIDSKKFILTVKKNNLEFNNEDHHDAHEYLMWLLDKLDENIKTETRKYSNPLDSVCFNYYFILLFQTRFREDN
jgi:uncharacterized UBP type Zn finger protein